MKEQAESENINLKKDFENLEKEFFEIQNIFESQKAEQDDDKKRFDDEISQAEFQTVAIPLACGSPFSLAETAHVGRIVTESSESNVSSLHHHFEVVF